MTEHGVKASYTIEAAPERRCREWYEAHGHAVYGYLRFHLPSAEEAEDLTAEVFLRALWQETVARLGVPPDRVVMAAIYERGARSHDAPVRAPLR